MQFVSTRGGGEPISFSQAVKTGLAPDGGLYLPQNLPNLAGFVEEWKDLSYPDLCFEFMKCFATDLDDEVLKGCIDRAYSTFSHQEIAPVKELTSNRYVCELFHGPTLAFKDFALQLLGQLYALQIKETGESLNILGATSGDTGSAAIHGLMNLPGIKIFILYPRDGVAPLQERQMTCTGSDTVFPIAIEGSFDDAQRWVKQLFADQDLKKTYRLSAINSINLARVLAQCVYYLYAWLRLPEEARKDLEVVVPTGNFGNVLAGWMLSQMGVHIPKFKIATNQNDILYRLFEKGEYRVTDVQPSLAPSMDIQVASNFERFLYYLLDQNPEKVRNIMKTFLETGSYSFEHFDRGIFSATRSDDESILKNTQMIFEQCNYVVDPHTACTLEDFESHEGTQLLMSTAHPAKFPEALNRSIGKSVTHPTLEALKSKEQNRYELPSDPEAIRKFIISKNKS